ncbi:MAG TPA: glycosyl hydrolase 108 family protein [Stellaceae bacterium]|nr:glycosyl hydrolase 108 family protein [Stellaceae bacterium]
MADFDAAFALVAGAEGGYVRDPADPGGETKFGISKRSYPALDIAGLTRDDAKAILRRDYWDKHRCGEMPWRWALAIFDGAVNQGSVVAAAQRVLGLDPDGAVGTRTLAALAGAGDETFHAFLAARAARYARDREFARFGDGWLTRLFRVAQAAEHAPA